MGEAFRRPRADVRTPQPAARRALTGGVPALVGLLGLCAAGAPAAAQTVHAWELGAAATAGLLVGKSDDFLDGGYGAALSAARRLSGPVWARVEFAYLGLDAAVDGTSSEVADNALLAVLAGPQLLVGSRRFGLALRMFAGTAGNKQSRERSSAEETTSWARALGAGATLRVGIADRLAIELGGDLTSTGDLEFARTAASGDVTTQDVAVLSLRAGAVLRLP